MSLLNLKSFNFSRECREYQSQRGPRDAGSNRPRSNYYEYESVQAIMSHAGGGFGREIATPAISRGSTHSRDAPTPPARGSAQQQPASLHVKPSSRGALFTSSYSSNHSATTRNLQSYHNTNNNSYHNTSSNSNSSQNSLPRSHSKNLHQHFTDNLPLVTSNRNVYKPSKHSAYGQQQGQHALHAPVPIYHSKSKSAVNDVHL